MNAAPTAPARVLWWTGLFWPHVGGVQMVGRQLLPLLRSAGFDMCIIAMDEDGNLPEKDRIWDFPLYRFPFHSALADRDLPSILRIRRRLREIREEFSPDLVHLHHLGPTAFFYNEVFAGRSTPLLLTLHEILFSAPPGRQSLVTSVMNRADAVVCCSQAVLEDARRQFPDSLRTARVIYSGLDPSPGEPSVLNFDPPVILCLGRAVRQKGFDIAVEALALLRQRHPSVRMVIAGDGPELAALKTQAAALGLVDSVEFPGAVDPDRVSEIIDRATLMVTPSRGQEGFGMVALQAAQGGRPVVASRNGGLQEIVRDGETGILVPPESPSSLADALEHLLTNPDVAATLGRAARERALNEFDTGLLSEQYVELYRSLSNQGRK